MPLDLMLSVILILAVLYIVVWIHGPRVGKMAKENRLLRHAKNYWRKRAEKRHLALVAVLCLVLFSIANPCPYSMPPAIGNEITDEMINRFGETLPDNTLHYPDYLPAADGDESSDSVTTFSETTDDDWMYYPDGGPHLEDYAGDMDAPDWTAKTAGVTLTQSNPELEVDIVLSTTSARQWYMNLDGYSTPGDDFHLTFWYKVDVDTRDVRVFIRTAADGGGDANGDVNFNPAAADTWYYGVVNVSSGSTAAESVLFSVTNYDPAGNLEVRVKDFQVWDIWEQHTGYFEDFTDVSDWTLSDTEDGDSFSTDGDLLSFTTVVNGSSDGDTVYSNAPSGFYTFWEIRYRLSTTSLGTFALGTYDQDGGVAGNINWWDMTKTTSWTTLRFAASAGVVESVRLYIYHVTGQPEVTLYVDYMRAGSVMGWQHDGSTTAGTEEQARSGWTYTITSSDGLLNLTYSRSGGSSSYGDIYLNFDTTSTEADIETDYYSFMEISWSCPVQTASNVRAYWYVDGKTQGAPSEFVGGQAWYGTFPSRIDRQSIDALTGNGGATKGIRFLAYGADGQKATILIDYVKAYSIANFTVAQHALSTTEDLFYVDSGSLVRERGSSTDRWMTIVYDPALSMDTSTYNVFNLTVSGFEDIGPADFSFQEYVGGWPGWHHEETRGSLASGTMTNFQFSCYAAGTLSAIKFIEDGTAPDILDKFVTPIIPDDDESVTLTAVTYDAVEVYEVTINAVVYPAGFVDIDYDLTEQTTNVLWSYEFSTLTAGYYLFQVTANDGANTYSEYIPVTVRVSIIEITTYTFFGASSDFSYMQYSGHISHDCTYNISEWSTSWAKNETHTGSVTEGMFNIAWDKISVDDAEANFTIVFVSGSLSLTIDGYYGTAYKLLRITEIEVMNMEESLALTNITINFYTNKDVDWYVYDRDDDDAVLSSGSSVEGSDDLYFLKNRIPYAHYYAVKWTDGVTNIWYNSSYWTYRQNVDSINPPGTDWGAKDQRKTIEFWVTVTAIIGGFGLIVLGIMNYDTRQQLKALQLPRYRTQERDRK